MVTNKRYRVGFQPDFVWVKDRTLPPSLSHTWLMRLGVPGLARLASNTNCNNAEKIMQLLCFDSDGFTQLMPALAATGGFLGNAT
jgi:hypothetical protein